MKKNIRIPDLGITSFTVPNTCIHCHKDVGFLEVAATPPIQQDGGNVVAITFLCPSCSKFSVYEYDELGYSGNFVLVDYSYTQTANVNLPNNIEKVSEEFVNIFKQAATAEAYGLKDICGVAYRKAAEFLIKDYVIRKFPENEEDIKNQFLGKIISDKLDAFPKIQTLAKATAWLGNDETHYVRKHSDKDLADLKAFLLAAATFIAADYDADEALIFINK
ncbi:DUF4145 domain-containing protein [Lactococcus lactis]|jgi:hypothetical protein|uniref:DUF4145 domain-containing protein n=1 Tax=Lactococcus lactis TaxID=1358 RepID=UPI001652A8F8|nr:DUF4145 domain-containing protein [Lactococcus lactis]QNL91302.1 DUF4145 domain-containing protein [Lactococcus lactis]